jgi:phage head maturation protease
LFHEHRQELGRFEWQDLPLVVDERGKTAAANLKA